MDEMTHVVFLEDLRDELKPGDVIWTTIPWKLCESEIQRIAAQIAESFPGHEAILFEDVPGDGGGALRGLGIWVNQICT